MMAPVSEEAFCVAMDSLVTFAVAYNVSTPEIESTIKIYASTVGHLPEDLLALAVERTVRHWTWGNRLPMPGELEAFIAPELTARTTIKNRIGTAGAQLRRDNDDKKKRADAFRWWCEDFYRVHHRQPNDIERHAFKGVGWRYREGGSYDDNAPEEKAKREAAAAAWLNRAAAPETSPVDRSEDHRKSVGRALSELTQNAVENASKMVPENMPNKMANAFAIAFAIGFSLFATQIHTCEANDLHGTAIADAWQTDANKSKEEKSNRTEFFDRTQDLTTSGVCGTREPSLAPPPRAGPITLTTSKRTQNIPHAGMVMAMDEEGR